MVNPYIIHRDISPSNLLLGNEGEVKIIDFGIAKAYGNEYQSVSGVLQGKLIYMSPEQANGQTIDHRSDIYALGLVAYEMITGIRPYEDTHDAQSLKKPNSPKFNPFVK